MKLWNCGVADLWSGIVVYLYTCIGVKSLRDGCVGLVIGGVV